MSPPVGFSAGAACIRLSYGGGARMGTDRAVGNFKADPIRFFGGPSDRKYGIIARILYPFG